MSKRPSTSGLSDAAGFAATRWTLVLAAARGNLTPRAAEAMAELCRLYWYPLYAYVRRCGHETHEAEDLTQEFFLRLLAKNFLIGIDREKGKFRAFLLASLKHFLANEWDRSQAQKRGGGQTVLPISTADAEDRYRLEPWHDLTPEKLFERRWALTVLDQGDDNIVEKIVGAGCLNRDQKIAVRQALKEQFMRPVWQDATAVLDYLASVDYHSPGVEQ